MMVQMLSAEPCMLVQHQVRHLGSLCIWLQVPVLYRGRSITANSHQQQ